MINPIVNGKLKHWNPDKGFGFIAADAPVGDVFIHISTLKHMSRLPVVGDVIYFQVQSLDNGKKQAMNARIAGVDSITPSAKSPKTQQIRFDTKTTKHTRRTKHTKHKKSATSQRLGFALIALALLVMGQRFYRQNMPTTQYQPTAADTAKPTSVTIPAPRKTTPTFRCTGKQHCSQMRSYEEALFYLKNCPNTKMDGDNDGIPCERQFPKYF